jgi:uncharacterized protein YydD (DUF2326 family)
MPKEHTIKFVKKTSLKGKEMKPEIWYYSTDNDSFVDHSLSADEKTARDFYDKYVELQGKMETRETLASTTINIDTI